MSRPGTFDRVYAALKSKLREGGFRPGDRLEPAALSDHLNASVTPVRDALHRLTGEGLVEAPRHEGFRVPMLTEVTLRHLYGWHRDLVMLALARRGSHRLKFRETLDTALAGTGNCSGIGSIIAAAIRSSGNPEHAAALEAVSERLEPLRQMESLLLDAVENEIDEILSALRDRDERRLRTSLLRYHRRRERIVPDLLEQLHSD
jgi:DNA-binding GntR family transcriptional regulator